MRCGGKIEGTMTKYRRAVALRGSLVILLFGGHLYAASKEAPAAPVPPLILTAKKVFIANGGGDESLFDSPQYRGGPDRLYNEFYAAVKSWDATNWLALPMTRTWCWRYVKPPCNRNDQVP